MPTSDHARAHSPIAKARPGIGKVFALGAAWGIPVMFLVTFVIARFDGVSWGAATGISAWGSLIGGPFFGAMVFFGGRVAELGE